MGEMEKEIIQRREWLEFQPQEDIRLRETTADEESTRPPEKFPELNSVEWKPATKMSMGAKDYVEVNIDSQS
jgi:hypothetical protein